MTKPEEGLLMLAMLVATAAPGAAQTSERSPLSGTSWQLVTFVGGDGATLTPADPARYTLEFAAEG